MARTWIGGEEIPENNKDVRQESDFDFPLIAWTNYIIAAPIVLTQPLVVPVAANIGITGTNLSTNTLTYTGTWAFLQGTDVWRIFIEDIQIFWLGTEPFALIDWVWGNAWNFTLNTAPVIWFDWAIMTDLQSVTVRNVNIINWSKPWVIDNMAFWRFDWIATANLSFDSGLPHFEIKTQVLEFQFNGVASQIQPNESFINVDSWISVVSVVNITNVAYRIAIFGWDFFAPGSLDEESTVVDVFNCGDQKNSQNAGQMNVPATQTVAITTIWVPVIINDANTWWTNIWSSSRANRFIFDASTWRLTYIWVRPTDATIIASLTIEKVGWWTDLLAWFIGFNGSIDPNSKAETKNTDPTSITCLSAQTIDTWDFFELFVENEDSTSDVVVILAQFIINA